MLGALYAALGALTFALNNASMRRGVVTGTVLQGMAVTVPVGALTFLVMALAAGTLGQVLRFPLAALAWLAGQGIVHFVLGRYCNYRSNQLVGVNLSAPVVQLQVPVAILLAVATLNETFTVLQAIGSVLMVAGSFTVQRNSSGGAPRSGAVQKFEPKVVSGYLFGLGAAFFYGASPLMARQAFLYAPDASIAAGGCVAYLAACLCFGAMLLAPGAYQSVASIKPGNMGWFLFSAVMVAVSQGFVYASLSVAPLLVVTPILQLSLIFRLFLSQWMNKDHEVMNAAVIVGVAITLMGSMLVSVDTDFLLRALSLPGGLARLLAFRLSGA